MRDIPILLGIVSADRAGANVERMEQACAGLEPVWYVPEPQVGDYEYAGATEVRPVLEREYLGRCMLPVQRNAVLHDALNRGKLAAQIDDDLRISKAWPTGIRWVVSEGEVPGAVTVAEALTLMRDLSGDALLVGVAPTTNAYFYSDRRPYGPGFVASKLTLQDPSQGFRYDTGLPLKEDYDLTMQYLSVCGGNSVRRLNGLLTNFASGIRGGVAKYRTVELERQVSAMLVERWAPHIALNPKRDGEVLLRWKP